MRDFELWGEDYYLKGAPLLTAGMALYTSSDIWDSSYFIKTVAPRMKSIRLVPMIGSGVWFPAGIRRLYAGSVGRVVYPDISMLPGGNAICTSELALTKLPSFLAGLLLAGLFRYVYGKRPSACNRLRHRQ